MSTNWVPSIKQFIIKKKHQSISQQKPLVDFPVFHLNTVLMEETLDQFIGSLPYHLQGFIQFPLFVSGNRAPLGFQFFLQRRRDKQRKGSKRRTFGSSVPWVRLGGWMEYLHPRKPTNMSPKKGRHFSRAYIWTNHWFSGDMLKFSGVYLDLVYICVLM